ncbi:hypothetical protein OTUT144_1742, partial [Orientia tsutsugamushi str. UT144]
DSNEKWFQAKSIRLKYYCDLDMRTVYNITILFSVLAITLHKYIDNY